MKYKALVHADNLLIYLSIDSFLLSFLHSIIYLFSYLFIHQFIHLFNKYTYYIHWKLYPLYLHYFTTWVWGRAGARIELRTLYSKLSSHDLKFWFFLFRCFMFLFVYVCVSVCVVCLFVLLCIYIILSEKVNDFASSNIFEVDKSHKELLICPRHRDDFGTRWLCNKKNCSCPSDWAPHGKSSRRGDQTPTLVPLGSREYTSEFHPDRHLDKR